jgi:hypothetical protein
MELEYTNVQKPMAKLTHFPMNLRQRMFFGDKLEYVPVELGESWPGLLLCCMQEQSLGAGAISANQWQSLGANCPKNRTCYRSTRGRMPWQQLWANPSDLVT